MSPERTAMIQAMHAELNAIAFAHQPGVLLSLDVEPKSMRRLREECSSIDELAEILHRAYELSTSFLLGARSAHLAWSRYEFVLRGTREQLVPIGVRLIESLVADPQTHRFAWLVVLTRIFEGDPLRTLCCDPGYALAPLRTSTLLWVDPYPGEKRMNSPGYPSTSILWQARQAS